MSRAKNLIPRVWWTHSRHWIENTLEFKKMEMEAFQADFETCCYWFKCHISHALSFANSPPSTCMTRQISAVQVLQFAMPQIRQLVVGFPPLRPGFEHGSGHVGFVVDRVALRQVFSDYFGFPCQFVFHRLLHNHHHLSSGAGTLGQTVAAVPMLSVSSNEKKKACSFPGFINLYRYLVGLLLRGIGSS
jgi:hypothetical protein